MKKKITPLLFLIIISGIIFTTCRRELHPSNQFPIAHAGKDTTIVLPIDFVKLDGSASSDPDGSIKEWRWTKISGPSAFTITNATVAATDVKTLVAGIYQFELKVTDNGGLSAKDTVQVTVESTPNRAPIANAGTDTVIILPGNTAILDGSGSTDPENNITGYAWTKISGPSSFNISNPTLVQTQVNNFVQGTYQFELKVTDVAGLFSKDTMQVFVRTPSNIYNCDISNRPLVNAELVPIGSLSQAREGVAVASAGNKILFAGGSDAHSFSSRVDIFDIITNTWTKAELSQARSNMGTAVLGNRIFFAGGADGSTANSSRVDIYDASTNSWTRAELTVGRSYIAAAAAGNKVVFAGGLGFFAPNWAAPPVDIYDASTNTWSSTILPNRNTAGRVDDAGITTTVIGTKIYFAGNASDWFAWDFGSITSTINIYDASTNSWSTSNLSIKRGFMAGISVGNKNYWAGGLHSQPQDPFTNLVEIRDENSGSSTFGCLFQPNAFFTAVEKNNKIVFFTPGVDVPVYWTSPPPVKNKFDIYDISTDTWSIGVLQQNIINASIISVNNTIYVAGGNTNGLISVKVWKLEF